MGVVVLGLVFGRIPFRVGGTCEVVPGERALLVARLGGLVKEVRVREGDQVAAGDEVICLDDQEIRLALQEQQSALAVSERRLTAFMATDRSRYQEEEASYELVQARIARLQEQLTHTHITSPIVGVVLTPNLEDLVGSPVREGQLLCEVAPLEELELEVAVPEELIGYVRVEQPVSFLLSAYPQQTERATVERIRLRSQPRGQRNTFVVTCALENPQGSIRPGMTGWAKVDCGYRSAGFVLLRKVIAYIQLRVLF